MLLVPGSAGRGDFDEGPLRLLLIDRQELFLEGLGQLLSPPRLRAAVVTATRSDSACRLATSGQVGMVICECGAEPESGLSLAARLAVDAPSVPVVLLGERGDERRLVEAFRAGVAGIFTKACIGEDLLRGVTAVLGGQRAMGVDLVPFALGEGLPGSRSGDDPLDALSPAEQRIFVMLGQALTVAEISAACGLSEKTVRNHAAGIYRKMGFKNQTQVVIRAARIGHENGQTPG